MTRSERWNEPRYFALAVFDGAAHPALQRALESSPVSRPEAVLTSWTLVGASKEMILRVAGDKFEIDFVHFGLDGASGCLTLQKTLAAINLDANDVKGHLASSIAQDVPFYPDDEEAATHLARLYSSLISDGLVVQVDDQEIQMRWSGPRPLRYDAELGGWQVTPTESVFPVDASALVRDVNEQQQVLQEAMRVLGQLRAAIAELSNLLSSEERHEAALQRCLTSYPVLFGLEYRRVIPKHRLGGSFEMDYALERSSGLVDLVEIEASNLRLYTAKGDPRKELVHAEQQVLDWLEWLEANARLARDDLPGLMRPTGQVVIGRRRDLSSNDKARLQRRNASWSGVLSILTYDDLLDRARDILRILGPAREDQASE